jgi:hypothetical protein
MRGSEGKGKLSGSDQLLWNIWIYIINYEKHLQNTIRDGTKHQRCFGKYNWACSKTSLTGESRFHMSTPLGIWTWVPCDGKQTGSPLDQWDIVRMKWDCRLSTGLPPSSRLCWLWSRKGDLQRAWNQDRKAVWDQVRLSHCRHEGLVMVRDEVRLRRGHDDQSRRVTNVARQR